MTKNQSFHVTIIEPKNYPSSASFVELAETVFYGLTAMGFKTTRGTNTVYPDTINIIFGAHLLSPEESALLPANTIVYNTEQISPDSQWKNSHLLELIKKFKTWDYSIRNIERLAEKGITTDVHHVPIGFVPPLCRIPKAAHQDIDVLFYGTINERRQTILQALIDNGLNVTAVVFCYGKERDALISRAKVVLNLHFYESKIFEIIRVSYLLSNRKAVVAEVDDETDIEPRFRNAVAGVAYEQLVNTCIEMVNNERRRSELEQRGFEIMSSMPEEMYLQKFIK